jgi:membrane protease subunit (stomatin/prohibitin family)
MSWIDKVRGELVDIVEWMDDDAHVLVWRFPRYHNQIKNGAQLIVRPGQVAILVHEGKVADTFEPGTHRLETSNLPLLSTLQGWKHGFDSPFKAEVYFFATRQVTDLKWGTPNPVIVDDPQFGALRVRAFGSYTLKARDPKTVLTELVGTGARYQAEEISELLRSIISQAFGELVAQSGMRLTDLSSNYAALSERLRRLVVERIDHEYGLDIPQMVIVNISVPDEVEKALDARSSIGIVGNLAAYQQYQVGRSTPVAAANPAGGVAGAGVGLGMGLAYANQVGASAAVPALHAAPPALPQWHVGVAGRSHGPLTILQLAEEIAAARVTTATLVWSPGMADWTPAARVPAIASLFGQVPPPLPPTP